MRGCALFIVLCLVAVLIPDAEAYNPQISTCVGQARNVWANTVSDPDCVGSCYTNANNALEDRILWCVFGGGAIFRPYTYTGLESPIAVTFQLNNESQQSQSVWITVLNGAPSFSSVRLSGELALNGNVVLTETAINSGSAGADVQVLLAPGMNTLTFTKVNGTLAEAVIVVDSEGSWLQ